MNLLTFNYNRVFFYFERYRSENLGLYFSFFLHLFILFFAIGLPNFFGPKQIIIPTIIPIEIVNVTDITSIPKKIIDNKLLETKNIKVKEKKFNSSNNQEIKKIDLKKKPKIKENEVKQSKAPNEKENIIIKEKKEIITELKEKKIENNTNEFESLPSKNIKPKLKPKPPIKDIEIKQKSDVMIETKPKPKPEPEFNIASMLKDLRNEKTSKKIDSDSDEKNKDKDIVEKIQEEKTNEIAQLSISEIDLVLQQLSKCFIAPAGAEIKKTMFVKISAKIQPNRRVYESSIRIIDTNISKNSPVYGPITESAMRTLLNPECIPLKLPEDKYDLWKNLTMKFDYSIMRGN